VKPIAKKSNKKAAFTIVELLTVMSVITLLIGLLVPALSMANRFARKVKQKAQFHSIEVALGLFNAEHDGYPGSDALDGSTPAGGVPYSGTLKLCEAMMGQDLVGFHPSSRFRADKTDGATPPNQLYVPATANGRIGPYLELENANPYKLKNLYGAGNTTPFDGELFALGDVYTSVFHKETGKRIGMPILYFRANISNVLHDAASPDASIYNFLDNDELVKLGIPAQPQVAHPMASQGTTRYNQLPADPGIFYEHIKNEKITTMSRPYRSDSFILLSAGFDGEYGTRDDVYNFQKTLKDFADWARP
jgi:type II secretory pathway pseudopilin PulG